MLVAPIPLALASSANSRFQASKPAGPLPHWAAFALVPRQTSTAMIAKILAAKTVAAKVAVASSLLPIIPTLLRRGPEQVARDRPSQKIAGADGCVGMICSVICYYPSPPDFGLISLRIPRTKSALT